LALLSVGFLAWFVAIRRAGVLGGWRRYIFLVAGLWYFLTFPTIQLPLFVIPNGTPSLVLLAGVIGILQLLMGVVVREQVRRPIAVGGEPYGTRSLHSVLHSLSRASVMASSRDIAWPTAHAAANASSPSVARAAFVAWS
jgi:hypothetical protein